MGYGARAAHWRLRGRRLRLGPSRPARPDPVLRLTTDLRLGFEGPRAGSTTLREGDTAFVALSVERAPGAARRYEATSDSTHRRGTGASGSRTERSPTTRGGVPSAQRADAEGSHVRPERRDGRRARRPRSRRRRADCATGTTGTRGSATRRSRCGRCTRSASTTRPTTSSLHPRRRRRGALAGAVRRRRRARPARARRSSTCPATRTRGRFASETRPPASASTTCGARCSTRSTCTPEPRRPGRRPGGCVRRGRGRRSRTGRSPTEGIWEVRGEPRHFTVSKVMCWVACDRGAARGDARRASGRSGGARRPRRSTPMSSRRGVTSAACSASTTTPSARRLEPAARRSSASSARRPRHRATVHAIARRADDRRPRAAVPGRGDRRRAAGDEGAFTICSFWWSARSRRSGRPTRRSAVREATVLASPLQPVRGGARPAQRPPPRELPAGLHPPRADQRAHARDPRRRRAGARRAAREDAPPGGRQEMTVHLVRVGDLSAAEYGDVLELAAAIKGNRTGWLGALRGETLAYFLSRAGVVAPGAGGRARPAARDGGRDAPRRGGGGAAAGPGRGHPARDLRLRRRARHRHAAPGGAPRRDGGAPAGARVGWPTNPKSPGAHTRRCTRSCGAADARGHLCPSARR